MTQAPNLLAAEPNEAVSFVQKGFKVFSSTFWPVWPEHNSSGLCVDGRWAAEVPYRSSKGLQEDCQKIAGEAVLGSGHSDSTCRQLRFQRRQAHERWVEWTWNGLGVGCWQVRHIMYPYMRVTLHLMDELENKQKKPLDGKYLLL